MLLEKQYIAVLIKLHLDGLVLQVNIKLHLEGLVLQVKNMGL